MASNSTINLPRGCAGLEATSKRQEIVKNLFYTQGEFPVLSIRPGVDQVINSFGRCRGQGLFRNNVTGDEELYSVSGDRLIRTTIINNQADKVLTESDVLIDDLGEITGNGEIILIGGFTKLLVMEVGGVAWVYDQVNGLLPIDDVNFVSSVSAAYDGGRFVFVPADGSVFFWSELDDPSNILPNSFADAEIFPDPNKVVYAYKSSIFIGGSRSFQRFNYDSTRDTYIPYLGEESTVGYVGGITGYGEHFAFIGNGADGDFNIYAMGGQPQAISNDFVSELINNEYTLSDIENAIGESFEWKGSTILIFHLPNHTLAFYGSGWALWQSGISGKAVNTWRINHVISAYGFTWTGDFNANIIGVLRDSGNEYGNDIEWLIKTNINATPETNFLIKRVTATATMGKSSGETIPRIGLGVSKDGRIPNQAKWLNLGVTGDYNHQLRWGSPVVKAYDGASLWFQGYGNVVMNLDGVYFE